MRKFYIFNINDEIALLTKDHPYQIYHNIEQIKKLKKHNIDIGSSIYEQIITPLNKNNINKIIDKKYQNNLHYQKVLNTHYIHNRYKPENTKLQIKNTYMLLETDSIKPSFLKELKNYNYFACDFENKDYFWLQEII